MSPFSCAHNRQARYYALPWPYGLIASVVFFQLPVLPACGEGATADSVSFRSEVAPILLENCLACHGPKKAEGGYRVDTYEQLIKAGDSGELPIAASTDQPSELLRRLVCEDDSERMPAESEPLLPEQIELIRRWIAGGGKFDGATASQPLALAIPPEHFPPPPEVYAQSVPITAVCFIDEGRHLVSGGYHELLFWNTENASLVRRIENIGQRVFALAVSPDRQTLAVGCGEPGKSGEVRLVDCASGKVKGIIARSDDVVLDIAYRPGSHELAVASADSSIRVIDVETQLVVRTIASHADWVTAVAWSDDGTRLASASRDKSAKVHDAVTGDLLASYLEHGAAVRGVLVLADNKQIVSVGADNRLHRWDIDGVKRVATVALGGEGFKMVRNQSELFVPCSDHRLLQINLETNQISQEFKGHDDWVLTACYAPSREGDGGFVASGSFDGQVRVWDTADARLIRNWNAKP